MVFFAVLDANISVEELTGSVGQMAAGKAPGLDGLPTIFVCTSGSVWEPTCGRCSQTGLHRHPGGMQFFHFLDLALLRNWRPVALLCIDYKLFLKVLTNRFNKRSGIIIHRDQINCVPDRSIMDRTLTEDCILSDQWDDEYEYVFPFLTVSPAVSCLPV